MLSGDIPPNQTIYIRNLNEKVKKEELKRSLYCLFSQYGRILDVIALKTEKLRGQAWVVFSEVTAASNAVRQMQRFPFYDKPMMIQFAKTKSDCLAKADGTYVLRDTRKMQDDKTERKERAEDQQSFRANGTAAQNGGATYEKVALEAAGSEKRLSVKLTNKLIYAYVVLGYEQTFRPSGQDGAALPNNILFIQNLPHETTSVNLERLFQTYPGFREVRVIEAKPGIAFVEFEDDDQSSVAMQGLQGFKISPYNPMAISYAKK